MRAHSLARVIMRLNKIPSALALMLLFGASAPVQSAEQHKVSLRARAGLEGVIEACQRSTIVALPDRHQDGNFSRFRLDLISEPRFADVANEIVIEWGNRLYQDSLDRYIAGEDVPESELRKIWRNTTVLTGLWDSPVYSQFLLAVRTANRKLPAARQMRVWAGDPPIDWEKIHIRSEFEQFAAGRDESVLSVIEQVLAKRHNVLLIMGGGHFLRGVVVNGHPGVVDLFEKAHPAEKIFVIGVTPSLNEELKSYPSSSFFFTKGTWLEELSSARGTIIYDGVLTLADGDRVQPPSSLYADVVYLRELNRRWQIVRGGPFEPQKLP